MSARDAEGVLSCKDCRHWHRMPPNPNTLGMGPVGECRGNPPQMLLVPQKHGIDLQMVYPPLPASFEPCGLFSRRLEVLA